MKNFGSTPEQAADYVAECMIRHRFTGWSLSRLLASEGRLEGLGQATLYRWLRRGAGAGWRIQLLAAYLRAWERSLEPLFDR